MIFLTVGTHEQPFNRLLKEIDRLYETGQLNDQVIAQIGYSTYVPKHYEYSKFLSYSEMLKYFKAANVVITHGGPASFIDALTYKKRPIVVPRQKKFNEHVNDHQLLFTRELKKRNFPIDCVEDVSTLGNVLRTNLSTSVKFESHTCDFVMSLIKVLEEKKIV